RRDVEPRIHRRLAQLEEAESRRDVRPVDQRVPSAHGREYSLPGAGQYRGCLPACRLTSSLPPCLDGEWRPLERWGDQAADRRGGVRSLERDTAVGDEQVALDALRKQYGAQ